MKTKRLVLLIALIVQSMPAISAKKTATIAERGMPAYEVLSLLNEQCETDIDEQTLVDRNQKVMIALDGVDCDVAFDLLYKVTELKNQDPSNGI